MASNVSIWLMPPSTLMKITCLAVPIAWAFCAARTFSGLNALTKPPVMLSPPIRNNSRRVRNGMLCWLGFMRRSSIIKDEIQFVQQAPLEILSTLSAILLDPRHGQFFFPRQRTTGQRIQIQFIHDLRAAL